MRRSTSTALFALAALFSLEPARARADGSDPPASRLSVNVHGLRSARGLVRCVAYDGAHGFPEADRHVIARVAARPQGSDARCEFDGLPAGRELAVVIHHDENGDNVFQRGLFGWPLEGYGFSNDARPALAAPSFDACRFRLATGPVTLRITARY